MVRTRFLLAYGALALAVALLVPAMAPLSGSMDAFAQDLANGTFRPFGPTGPAGLAPAFTGNLGGLTGESAGNYLPGATPMPSKWLLDRDGRGGHVVIDYVFNPSLGAMKRLKAFDKVDEAGTTLLVGDTGLRQVTGDPTLTYDRRIEGSFAVQFHSGQAIPIYSVHPKNRIDSYSTEPAIPGGVVFLRDGADTIYAIADYDGIVQLHITYRTSSEYYSFTPFNARASDYPLALRPVVPADLREEAQVVLARAGVSEGADVKEIIDRLNTYFRSFTEGDIPAPSEVESLYQALALGGHGCCRHRAFAYMVTAQAAGIPTRAVVNEAHAFVEVATPEGHWQQINLGGCGSYSVNNPNDHPSLFDQARDPRGEANPDENRPLPVVVSFTNITESPDRIVKGQTYYVNGTVEGPDGRPVPGARVDVYLNETKTSPGRLAGAGTTGITGKFVVEARVPKELAARSYQLVARSAEGSTGTVRFEESWSDPPVEVFTPTRFVFPTLRAAVGFPADVTGRLLDIDGNAVANAPIRWSFGGEDQPIVTTDGRGGFTARANFTQTGLRSVAFSYTGDDHHGPSFGNATILVEQGAILLPGEAETLERGHEGPLTGTVALAGVDLGGRAVRVTLRNANGTTVLETLGTTDARGRFAVPVTVDARTPPAIVSAQFEVESLQLSSETLVRIAARPILLVEAPDEIGPGEPFLITVALLRDSGEPLESGNIALFVDDETTPRRRIATGADGLVRFPIGRGAFEPGDHTLRIVFEGDDDHTTRTSTTVIHLAPPWYRLLPAWAYAAAAGVVLLLVGGVWMSRSGGALRTRWHHGPSGDARVGIVFDFPDHPDGIPPVAEPDGITRVHVGLRDREGRPVRGRVMLTWGPGRGAHRVAAVRETDASFDVPTPREGDLTLHARATGVARWWTRPATHALPATTYREAVERGYVALRERTHMASSASPQELVRALDRALDPDTRVALMKTARLFEVADYSETPVDRAFYHAFARARIRLEERLSQEDALGG